LNSIIGYSEVMLDGGDGELNDEAMEDIDIIYTSGKHLLNIINDILDLSKVDAGKLEVQLEPVRLNDVIDNAMMTAAGLMGNKPVELRRNVPHRLPPVFADESRLRQVLINLYSNAAKFTDHGSITISTQIVGADMQISVTDTGQGIHEDSLEKIFDEFSQVEAEGRDPRAGAGLGLTISRKLLNLMNGRIWAESVYGEGATFHVTIPIYNEVIHSDDMRFEDNTVAEAG
ncbi:MAG: HAMP domain-containing sensor histidine kinase, partial [Chloroflexota bacterium]